MAKTKTSPSDQLAALQQRRDELHAVVRDAKRQMNEWDSERETMRAEFSGYCHLHPDQLDAQGKPLPGTEAAALHEAVRERLATDNPYTGDFEEARGAFTQADAELQRFQQTRLRDLLAELEPEHAVLAERFRDGLRALVEAGDAYAALAATARALVVATPGLDGSAVYEDPRPLEWRAKAAAALDEDDLLAPGLTPVGSYELDRVVAYGAEEAA